MSKLLKPTEYAEISGLSRQAIYAQIKNNTIESKKVDGRLFVVVKDEEEKSTPKKDESFEAIIASKDETIKVLQAAIDDLKESNDGVIQTLQSEIELLKQAFSEMRGVYKEAISYKPQPHQKWQSIKKYCKANGIKMTKKFHKEIKKLYKEGDKRVKKVKDRYFISGAL